MKLNDELPRVQLTIAKIMWPNKKILTFKDFLNETIFFIGKEKSIKKYPYSKFELVEMFIELIDELDKDLKEAIIDMFFIDFVKDSIDPNELKKSDKYNDIVSMFKIENVKKLNKFILHRELIVRNKNEKYYDCLFESLNNEILNNKSISILTNIIADITCLADNNEDILKKIELYKHKILKKIVEDNDDFSLKVLLVTRNNILLTALKDVDLLNSTLKLSSSLMKDNLEACFSFFISIINEMPNKDKFALINKVNINEILNCSQYSLTDDLVSVNVNKKHLLLLNHWNRCFRDILTNELSSINLEKDFSVNKYLLDILVNGLDKKIISLTKLEKNIKDMIIHFKFNEEYKDDNKDEICKFLSVTIKNLLLDLDNITNKDEEFVSSFEKVLMKNVNKKEQSKIKLKKF